MDATRRIDMPLVSEEMRNIELEKLPSGIRKLCTGSIKHERLDYRCRTSNMYCYSISNTGESFQTSWDSVEKPQILPLWECDLSLVAKRGDEFVEIDYEDPEELLIISFSIQGVLAYLFYYLVEDFGGGDTLLKSSNQELKELENISDEVGFNHLMDVLKLQIEIGSHYDCSDKLLMFTKSLF